MLTLAHGTTRMVILTRRYAVKVPSLRRDGHGWPWSLAHGILANLSELRLSRTGAAGIAPVIAGIPGLAQIYPRCAPLVVEPVDYHAIADPAVPVDPRPHNVGLLADRVVFLDYADSAECVACERFHAPCP